MSKISNLYVYNKAIIIINSNSQVRDESAGDMASQRRCRVAATRLSGAVRCSTAPRRKIFSVTAEFARRSPWGWEPAQSVHAIFTTGRFNDARCQDAATGILGREAKVLSVLCARNDMVGVTVCSAPWCNCGSNLYPFARVRISSLSFTYF